MSLFQITNQTVSSNLKASWLTGNSRSNLKIAQSPKAKVPQICTNFFNNNDDICNITRPSDRFCLQGSIVSSSLEPVSNNNNAQNNYAVLIRSQLLAKNMRENTFNFYDSSVKQGFISYTTKYFYTEQKIHSIFYINKYSFSRFNQQSQELKQILSQYDPISQNLNKQYSFVVSDEFLDGYDIEFKLNEIANEYSTNFSGQILSMFVELNTFTIDFDNKRLDEAIEFANLDDRILQQFKNGFVQKTNTTNNWTGGRRNSDAGCFNLNWYCNFEDPGPPRTLCRVTQDGRIKTVDEIISEIDFPAWGDPDRDRTDIQTWLRQLAYWSRYGFTTPHLLRLSKPELPLPRYYSGRTKPRNRLISQGGTCEVVKEPVYVYIMDEPVPRTWGLVHREFEGRLKTFYGPISVDSNVNSRKASFYLHGIAVASLVGGRNVGVTRKPELVSVGVLGAFGGTYELIANGIARVINDKQNNPDRKIIMNFSLGGLVSSADLNIMEYAILKAIDNGIVVVVAAGNNNIDANNFSPARMPEVVTVGSTVVKGQCSSSTIGLQTIPYVGHPGHFLDFKTSFSNFGSVVDLYAPGDGMRVARPPSSVFLGRLQGDQQGTSFSSPLAAGVAVEIMRHSEEWANDYTTQLIIKNLLIGYSVGGPNGIKGEWGYQDNYGIIGLVPGRDNNLILQNPYSTSHDQEDINNLDDPEDCGIPTPKRLQINQQPAINNVSNKVELNVKMIYGIDLNEKELDIPDIGIQWQSRSSFLSDFETFAYGQSVSVALVPTKTLEVRAVISYPGITGLTWDITELSLISNTVCFGFICQETVVSTYQVTYTPGALACQPDPVNDSTPGVVAIDASSIVCGNTSDEQYCINDWATNCEGITPFIDGQTYTFRQSYTRWRSVDSCIECDAAPATNDTPFCEPGIYRVACFCLADNPSFRDLMCACGNYDLCPTPEPTPEPTPTPTS